MTYFIQMLTKFEEMNGNNDHDNLMTDPIIMGGKWNTDAFEDPKTVKYILKKLRSLQGQYIQFKAHGVADKLLSVKGAIPEYKPSKDDAIYQ